MRMIGHLPNESSASAFSDYLYVQGISNEVEAETEGWAVWIHSEDEWTKAKEMLAMFLGNPADPKYRQQAGQARQLRAQAAAADEPEEQDAERARILQKTMPYGVGPLTGVFIGLCLVVQILTEAGYSEQVLRELYMTALEDAGGGFFRFMPALPEIQQGEFWRLFTPVMVHRDWLHLLLNMLWLLDLGSMIEGRQSTGRLGWMVLFIAVLSNLTQYLLKGPVFCGMSGVVYGLLAYVWMKSRFDPASGLFLHPHTAIMMLFWFFLCMTPAVPGIANGAHAAGLILGAFLGFLGSMPAFRRRSR